MKKYPTVLCIGGSDPTGGAGIQADMKTATICGAYAMGVVTCLTVQNSSGFYDSFAVEAEIIKSQLEALLNDISPDSVKIGMVPNKEVASIINNIIINFNLNNIVIDPVFMPTLKTDIQSDPTLSRLIEYYRSTLINKCDILTPNYSELCQLLGLDVDENHIFAISDISKKLGMPYLLLKGGHLVNEDNNITDLLYVFNKNKSSIYRYNHKRISTTNLHGTGCFLSTSIASYLANGLSIIKSVEYAIEKLEKAIVTGADYKVWNGNYGNLNFLESINYKNI